MPIGVALGIAGAGLVGDIISQQGQQETNVASAQQAALNRQFQAQQQTQVEDWETQMSDTAMQRRVQDLKAAGLNPLLAVGQGGASQPSVSPATGSMPSFANPSSAFGQMGMQAGGAVAAGQNQAQTDSNVKLQTQQASAAQAKAASDQADAHLKEVMATKAAGVDTAVGQQSIAESQSRQGLMSLQGEAAASQARLNTQSIAESQRRMEQISASIGNIHADTDLKGAQMILADANSRFADMSADQIRTMLPGYVQQLQLKIQGLDAENTVKRNIANFAVTDLGKQAPAIMTILPMVNTALSVGGAAMGAARGMRVGGGGTFSMDMNQ